MSGDYMIVDVNECINEWDTLMFDIWTGEIVKLGEYEDSFELPVPYFYLSKSQYPIFLSSGEYIGMIYNNVFFDDQMIYDIFNDFYGID